jgi:hypothetical protein
MSKVSRRIDFAHLLERTVAFRLKLYWSRGKLKYSEKKEKKSQPGKTINHIACF